MAATVFHGDGHAAGKTGTDGGGKAGVERVAEGELHVGGECGYWGLIFFQGRGIWYLYALLACILGMVGGVFVFLNWRCIIVLFSQPIISNP